MPNGGERSIIRYINIGLDITRKGAHGETKKMVTGDSDNGVDDVADASSGRR
ncbi:hypothetical protein [Limosilactobacillus reuteri]|uniref:hypothetical protein n=1 Tax=Limosilactobacillus reuteri TaxID=1598 RepID=UPI003CFD1796